METRLPLELTTHPQASAVCLKVIQPGRPTPALFIIESETLSTIDTVLRTAEQLNVHCHLEPRSLSCFVSRYFNPPETSALS
ncbi:hypothetical protein HYQ46_006320 [Verticillium longisporum]|nr:hypothetical protein HYQ46_006320 [Verticillium longisporum]